MSADESSATFNPLLCAHGRKEHDEFFFADGITRQQCQEHGLGLILIAIPEVVVDLADPVGADAIAVEDHMAELAAHRQDGQRRWGRWWNDDDDRSDVE